jgi:hypothetical protein
MFNICSIVKSYDVYILPCSNVHSRLVHTVPVFEAIVTVPSFIATFVVVGNNIAKTSPVVFSPTVFEAYTA